MDRSEENAPLAAGSISGSQEALTTRRGGSNSRAFKVAGLTTLVCLLVAGQVFTAYLVFNQKEQIRTLQKTSSDDMSRRVTYSGPAVPMKMAMHSPLLPLLTEDNMETEIPKKKLGDVAVVSVEQHVRNLLNNSQLPHFNGTFQANLLSLRERVEDSQWKEFVSWTRHWLVFQMAQEKTPTPHEHLPQTKCQKIAARKAEMVGTFQPQCDEAGQFIPRQCWHSTGFCWCVDKEGTTIPGTIIRGRPQCQRGHLRSRMIATQEIMPLKTLIEEE